MTTLFDLALRSDSPASLVLAVKGVVEQYGMFPHGDAPCSCAKCTAEHADAQRHQDGIEETAWRRTDTAGKAWVLSIVHGSSKVKELNERLLAGERELLKAWSIARPLAQEIATPEDVQEAEDWLRDVTGAALEALFPWSSVRASLRNVDLTPSAFYREVYAVLVDLGKANPNTVDDFVSSFTTTSVSEWRFQGRFGFGGKFYRAHGRCRVGCYSEDLTAENEACIAAINARLDALVTKYGTAILVPAR